MLRLIWTQEAQNDLLSIDSYLTQIDPAIARATLRAILESAQRLEQFPAIGPSLGTETRSLRAKGTHYVIVYTLRGERVAILHIYHDRQDWRPDGQPA